MIRGSYLFLKKDTCIRIKQFKRRKFLRKLVRRLKHFGWLIYYLKKNKQTQWRYGYNNSRLSLLIEKNWYPMKCKYIKHNNLGYLDSLDVNHNQSITLNNIIANIWDDSLDLNDFNKKI